MQEISRNRLPKLNIRRHECAVIYEGRTKVVRVSLRARDGPVPSRRRHEPNVSTMPNSAFGRATGLSANNSGARFTVASSASSSPIRGAPSADTRAGKQRGSEVSRRRLLECRRGHDARQHARSPAWPLPRCRVDARAGVWRIAVSVRLCRSYGGAPAHRTTPLRTRPPLAFPAATTRPSDNPDHRDARGSHRPRAFVGCCGRSRRMTRSWVRWRASTSSPTQGHSGTKDDEHNGCGNRDVDYYSHLLMIGLSGLTL